MNVDVPMLQEERLRERAFAEGCFDDLLTFYAVKQDLGALCALEGHLGSDQEESRLLFDVFLGEKNAPLSESLLERVSKDTEAWLLYTLAKGYLRHGQVPEVVRLINYGLDGGGSDVSVLNLLAKYLSTQGDGARALESVQATLQLNPYQPDMAELSASLEGGEPRQFALYLEVAPKWERVAFYLPAYNVEAYIESAIEGILDQNYPILELIVVDDGSPDRSIELAQRFPVRVLAHDENRGLAAARNTAVRNTVADFIGSIDTDACPDRNYAKHVMMEFENGAADVAGVGGRLIELNTVSPADKWRAIHLEQNPGDFRIHEPEFIHGNNNIFRRSALLAVGGYDEKYRTNAEDGYISDRLREEGFSLTYTPHPVAFHMREDTLQSVVRTKWGWAFWVRHRRGEYDGAEALVRSWRVMLNTSVALLNQDVGRGYFDILYLDLLLFFSDVCLDVGYAIREGMISAPEGRFLQESVVDSVGYLDDRFGGNLGGRIRADLGPFLQPEGPGMACYGDVLRDLLTEVHRLYETVAETTYEVLAGEGGVMQNEKYTIRNEKWGGKREG